jgi:thiol:disulfide interchange protein
MDKTDPAVDPGLVRRSPEGVGGSQSKLSPILFWVLLAAILFRVVTTVTDKNRKAGGEGLVHWQPHESALAQASRSGKRVLYDFTAAWCQPCHRMDKEAWGDAEIAEKVNAGFVAARVVDRQNEDGRNPPSIQALQEQYHIQAFPTLLVTDIAGREIARSEGFGGREAVARFLDQGRTAPPRADASRP